MVSIIVLSSDGYDDCWNPFFDLLAKNFPLAKNYEIILSTNSKDYHHEELKIKVLRHGMIPWSKRFKDSVVQAKYDIIFMLVEDDFLRSPMDPDKFKEFVRLIQNDSRMDHIRLLSTFERTKMTSNKIGILEEIAHKTKLRLTYLPGLWKREILLKYLVDYEAPFMAEKIADWKSWLYNDGFYAVSREYVDLNGQFYNGMASGGIFRGKWADWVVPFFKKNNIEMDYNIRGFATEEFRSTTRMKSRIDLLKNPITTIRSFLSLSMVYLKVKILKLK
jgi:hypothetical protein